MSLQSAGSNLLKNPAYSSCEINTVYFLNCKLEHPFTSNYYRRLINFGLLWAS